MSLRRRRFRHDEYSALASWKVRRLAFPIPCRGRLQAGPPRYQRPSGLTVLSHPNPGRRLVVTTRAHTISIPGGAFDRLRRTPFRCVIQTMGVGTRPRYHHDPARSLPFPAWRGPQLDVNLACPLFSGRTHCDIASVAYLPRQNATS